MDLLHFRHSSLGNRKVLSKEGNGEKVTSII